MMQEFIQMAVEQLGMKESGAKKATGGLLNMIKDNAPKGDFQELLGKLPGAQEVMKDAGGGSGGMLGSLGGMLGGKAGSALSIASLLEQSGLSTDKLGKFASMFLGFVEGKAGKGLLDKVLANVPEIKKLIG
ncbi:MAG: DUF2780 domain-containing protein [Phycisphaeraceae bacterium]|nr:DUF2780 domain-containing protein [Phycisphaerales bacterium]MCB9841698.1 DUF2780 domain-containing protein [Phycisphaeraceae bacterium]